MITKQHTTTGYAGKIALGMGLVGVVAVLIATIALASRPGTLVAAASLQLPASIRTIVNDLAHTLGFGESVMPMQSAPLGIDAPQGVDVRSLPRGLTDYIRPGSIATTAQNRSHQLGIDLPRGTDLRLLPRGLSDYLRQGN